MKKFWKPKSIFDFHFQKTFLVWESFFPKIGKVFRIFFMEVKMKILTPKKNKRPYLWWEKFTYYLTYFYFLNDL